MTAWAKLHKAYKAWQDSAVERDEMWEDADTEEKVEEIEDYEMSMWRNVTIAFYIESDAGYGHQACMQMTEAQIRKIWLGLPV